MTLRKSCALCGAPGVPAGEKSGHLRKRAYRLARCAKCGFAWVVDADDDYAALYDDAYYDGRGADPLVDYLRELSDPRTLRRYEWEGLLALARGAGARAGGTWLDFGGGAGGFASFLSEHGFDARAYDTGAGAQLGRAHGVPVIDDAQVGALAGACDVVSAIEVAEHVPDPQAFFARIAALLRPGGVFVITTGNVERAPRELARWRYVMPEIHISFYTPGNLRTLYAQAGLEPVDMRGVRGWSGVVRYKTLKTLGIHRAGGPAALLPWALLAPSIDRTRGVSAMPFARKPR
jgi:2-polyprenyl-6-hydroxyphenyl methylase/3-demethylubiquinone-9 3-methyltransferase